MYLKNNGTLHDGTTTSVTIDCTSLENVKFFQIKILKQKILKNLRETMAIITIQTVIRQNYLFIILIKLKI